MRSDTQVKIEGFEILSNNLGLGDAERFIALVQREKFDYVKWRKNLLNNFSGEEISKNAMLFIEEQNDIKTK